MVKEYKTLTPEEVNFFMENGYIILKGAFSKDKAEEWQENMWVRLNVDPNDKSTWYKDRIHMPSLKRQEVSEFAPRAWGAMKDLLGGEERIDEKSSMWGDSFIVNLGSDEFEGPDKYVHPHDLGNWHVDGDFFVHFLDSPEQALLVIPIFSDIKPRGGGTYICPEGIDMIANYLAEHPEGVLPTGLSFTPSTWKGEPKECPEYWSHLKEIKRCSKFVELTGEIGDVVLLHPLMLHSASKNFIRIPRVITNPPVGLREPFQYNRENPDDFSLVELKTLKALGVDRLDFKITAERRGVTPKRVLEQQKMMEEEKKRLAALAAAKTGTGIEATPRTISVA